MLKASQALLFLSGWLKKTELGDFKKCYLFLWVSTHAFLLNSNCMTQRASNKVWAIKPLFRNILQALKRVKSDYKQVNKGQPKYLCFVLADPSQSIKRHKESVHSEWSFYDLITW